MNLFPYKSYIFKTALTQDEVIQHLANSIEPVKLFRLNFFSKVTKPYEGKIYNNSFYINRITGGSSPFLPFIEGKISNLSNTTNIRIKMRMSPLGYILWLGILCILCVFLVITIRLMVSEKKVYLGSTVLFFITILCYLFGVLSFNIESGKSKKFLDSLLNSN